MFDEFVDRICQRARNEAQRVWQNVGLTFSLNRAYEEYAQSLENPSEFHEAWKAVEWWNRGGWRWYWRHWVYRQLYPRRYWKRRLLWQKGNRMKQQALLNAVLEKGQNEPETATDV